MGLFTQDQMTKIMKTAEKSREALEPVKPSKKANSVNAELTEISNRVIEYFKDSPAILIRNKTELHEYVTKAIESGYIGIDTETTGLDRIRDTIVGWSMYYPGGVECYIPCKHLVPIFNEPYKNQLTYEESAEELQRLVDAGAKMILANADFDVAMIYKDFHVDILDNVYYDVILAWRCLKENETDNALKVLYSKYVLKGKGDPKKFSDFFTPQLFPFSKPEVAGLYAANDAKITYDLFVWQLPYVTKTHDKCKKARLEKIADLVWNIEIPMIKVCALMHRYGIFYDNHTSAVLHARYHAKYDAEVKKLAELVDDLIKSSDLLTMNKAPFTSGATFKESSPLQVKFLCNQLIKCNPPISETGKETLTLLNHPVTNQILKVRGASKLLDTYVDKLPKVIAKDNRVHARFNSIGASTGRMSSSEPNMQNIPSHATDIRHSFRATPVLEDVVNCVTDENSISVKLFHLDRVTTDNGDKPVKDLTVGDNIHLFEGSVSVVKQLTHISEKMDSNGNYVLTFAV